MSRHSRVWTAVLAVGFGLSIVNAVAVQLEAQGLPDPTGSAVQGVVQVLDSTDPAQVGDEVESPPVGQAGEVTQLIFEREVFSYPVFQRRNPFQGLLTVDTGGPRFEDLRLTAIVMSSVSGQSVALFTMGQVSAQPGGLSPAVQTNQRALRARVGDRVGGGNLRVVEIQARLVVIEVEEFGVTQRRTMRIARPGGQGGPK